MNSKLKTTFPDTGAANSGAVNEADPLAVIVAAFTPEQRAALVRLLIPSPNG